MEARLVYLEHDSFPVAAGVGFFNPSLVSSDTSRVTGISFATDFSRFLSDPLVSYPTIAVNPGSCANEGIKAVGGCVSSYFVPGGLSLISPWPSRNKTLPESPLYTVSKCSGYQFDFSAIDPAARFDGTKDCNVYGDGSSAVQFCLTTSNDTLLNMSELHYFRRALNRENDSIQNGSIALTILPPTVPVSRMGHGNQAPDSRPPCKHTVAQQQYTILATIFPYTPSRI